MEREGKWDMEFWSMFKVRRLGRRMRLMVDRLFEARFNVSRCGRDEEGAKLESLLLPKIRISLISLSLLRI